MQDTVAAGRYAQALFDLAREMEEDQAVEDELDALSEALKKAPVLERMLMNPALTLDQKKRIFERLYGHQGSPEVTRLMSGFLAVLIEKSRFTLIHAVAESYKRIADAAQGESVAEVTSSVSLSAAEEARLVPTLERVIGTKILIKKTVDPALLGGLLVRVRNKIFDGSVRGQLDRLRKELTQKEA